MPAEVADAVKVLRSSLLPGHIYQLQKRFVAVIIFEAFKKSYIEKNRAYPNLPFWIFICR